MRNWTPKILLIALLFMSQLTLATPNDPPKKCYMGFKHFVILSLIFTGGTVAAIYSHGPVVTEEVPSINIESWDEENTEGFWDDSYIERGDQDSQSAGEERED